MRGLFGFAVLVVTAALALPVSAEQSVEDAYAACLIGNAVVELHNGADKNEAEARAFATCESYSSSVDETEGEGISDFMDSVLDQLGHSS